MEQIRAFIAIELPDELKQELERLETRLKAGNSTPVKWVEPGSIHLTLKFLGDIDAGRTGEITKVMEEAVEGMPPVKLEVKGLGVFPNQMKTQVAWVGLEGEIDKLGNIQQNLELKLENIGYKPEKRGFTPHLTLARVRDRATPDERQKFGRLVTETEFEAGTITIDAINLIRSQLTRQGAIYSRISFVRLK